MINREVVPIAPSATKRGRGAPVGNRNAAGWAPSRRFWTEAIIDALMIVDKKTKRRRLEMIAEKMVELALDGDVTALREIGDRIEGRVSQMISLDPENSALTIVHKSE